MAYERPKYFDQFETQDSPKDLNNENWMKYPDYGFRVSWRIHSTADGLRRDFRNCIEEDLSQLERTLSEEFGPIGGRWTFDPAYVYIYLRSPSDFMEFRLKIELPK